MDNQKVTWNFNDTLQGKSDKELISKVTDLVEHYARHKEDIDSYSPAQIHALLKEKEEIGTIFNSLGSYYGLQLTQNTQDKDVLAKDTSFEQLATDLSNKMLFFPIWFIHLPEERIDFFINDDELIDYKYYLSCLKDEKPYTFDEKTEQIISLKSISGAGAIFALYEIYTSAFTYSLDGREGLSKDQLIKYAQCRNPTLREEAYQKLLTKFGDNSTILTEMYKNIVIDWTTEALKIRGHKSSLSVRNRANDISDEAVNALLNTVQKNIGVFTEYFQLKYDMNIKNGSEYPFSRFHLYAPFEVESDEHYPYEKSKEIVLSTYKQFSELFYDSAKLIFDANHVHSHPQKFKRGGAFCLSNHTGDIPYVMLNHDDDLKSVFTMMHEFGHGIHGVLSRGQNDTNYHVALPIAETASIFGEMLLSTRLLNESKSDNEKKAILAKLLDDQYASIGRQSYFVIFEKYAHEAISKGATQDELEAKWLELLKEQFGDMEVPDVFKHEFSYIPHIHETPFYCYAYAWGNLFVLALFAMFKEEGESFKDKFTALLSAGGNAPPEELMAKLGINPKDESFWQKGFDIIQEEIKELKQLK